MQKGVLLLLLCTVVVAACYISKWLGWYSLSAGSRAWRLQASISRASTGKRLPQQLCHACMRRELSTTTSLSFNAWTTSRWPLGSHHYQRNQHLIICNAKMLRLKWFWNSSYKCVSLFGVASIQQPSNGSTTCVYRTLFEWRAPRKGRSSPLFLSVPIWRLPSKSAVNVSCNQRHWHCLHGSHSFRCLPRLFGACSSQTSSISSPNPHSLSCLTPSSVVPHRIWQNPEGYCKISGEQYYSGATFWDSTTRRFGEWRGGKEARELCGVYNAMRLWCCGAHWFWRSREDLWGPSGYRFAFFLFAWGFFDAWHAQPDASTTLSFHSELDTVGQTCIWLYTLSYPMQVLTATEMACQ